MMNNKNINNEPSAKRTKIEMYESDAIELYSGTFQLPSTYQKTQKKHEVIININSLSKISFSNYDFSTFFYLLSKKSLMNAHLKSRCFLVKKCTVILKHKEMGFCLTIEISNENKCYRNESIGVFVDQKIALTMNGQYQMRIFCHKSVQELYNLRVEDIHACTSISTKPNVFFLNSKNIKDEIFQQLDEMEFFLANSSC